MQGLIRLSFDVAGVRVVDRLLGVQRAAIGDLKPAFEEIADSFYKGNRETFQQEGAIGSGWSKWAPLSPAYAAEKRRLGYPNKILERSGDLKRSLTVKGDKNAYKKITNEYVELSTNVEYALYHQTGAERTTSSGAIVKLPKREPIRINETRKREWVRIIQSHISSHGGLTGGRVNL